MGMVWDRKRALNVWEAVKAKRLRGSAEKKGVVPTGTLRRIPSFKGSLPAHCMKKSLIRSTLNLARDVTICATIAGLAVLIKASPVGQFCSERFFLNQMVNFFLWTIYALAQGTVAFGVWVLGYEAAGGRFSEYRVLNHFVGITLHTLLLIPYRPCRANREGERDRASLMRCLADDSWAIFKVPSWNTWQSGFLGALTASVLYGVWGYHWGWYQLFKWIVGPWIVLNSWMTVYHWLLENGPQDAGQGLMDTTRTLWSTSRQIGCNPRGRKPQPADGIPGPDLWITFTIICPCHTSCRLWISMCPTTMRERHSSD